MFYRDWDLMTRVAKHLAGDSVILRRQPAAYFDANAHTWRDKSGAIVIDIYEAVQSDRDLFRTFTHEAAHAKLHAPRFLPSQENEFKTPQKFADRVTTQAILTALQQKELEAETQADKFRKFAIAHAEDRIYPAWLEMGDRPHLTPFQKKLFALLRYPKE